MSVKDSFNIFFNLFGYYPRICKIRNTKELVSELSEVMINCVNNKDDSDLLKVIFKDYESYYSTRPVVTNKDKEVVVRILNKSIEVDADLINLYNKGVASEMIDLLVWSMQNKELLVDIGIG